MPEFFLILLALIVIIVSCVLISKALYRKMKSGGYRFALLTSIVVFLASFLIISYILVALIDRNVRFER